MRQSESRVLRAIAAFLTAAGVVLAILAAGVVLREFIAPPAQTWSAWTRGAILATSLLAIVFCVAGGLLSFHVHRARRDSVRTFLTRDERARVASAVRDAEAKTSGEIVVHVAHRAHYLPTLDARKVFEKMGMTNTRERNGVLFFVSVRDRKLAVIGDKGIHEHVAPDFWAEIVKDVEHHFAEGRFVEGLSQAIDRVGVELARHFPHRADDVNELPDVGTDDDTRG